MSFSKKALRSLTLSTSLKNVFLEGLAVQVKAGLTAEEVFAFTLENTDDIGLRALAEVSLASATTGKPFSDQYVEEGFFSVQEAELLAVAEEHNALPEVISFMLEDDDESQGFWGVVVLENATWIASFLAIVAVLMLAVVYEPNLSFGIGSRASIFEYGDWFWANGLAIGMLVGLILCAYLFARRQLDAQARSHVRWLGFSAPSDFQFMIGLSRLFSLLFGKGVAQNTALGVAVKVFDTGGFPARSLREAYDDAQGHVGFVQSLKQNIFGPTIGLQLELLAGRGSLAELETAFASLQNILSMENMRLLKKLKMGIAVVCGGLFFGLCVPLVEYVLGGNLVQ